MYAIGLELLLLMLLATWWYIDRQQSLSTVEVMDRPCIPGELGMVNKLSDLALGP